MNTRSIRRARDSFLHKTLIFKTFSYKKTLSNKTMFTHQ